MSARAAAIRKAEEEEEARAIQEALELEKALIGLKVTDTNEEKYETPLSASSSSSSSLGGRNRVERVEAALSDWVKRVKDGGSTMGPFKLHASKSTNLDETQARLDRVRARAYKALGTGGPGGSATTSDPKHFVLAYTKEIEMFGKDPENEDLQKRIFFNSKRATHDPAIRAWLSEHPEEKSELSKVMQHVSSLATGGKTTLSTKFKERVIAL